MLDDYYKRKYGEDSDIATAQSSSSSSKRRAPLTLVEAPGVRKGKEVINVDGDAEPASDEDAFMIDGIDYSEDVEV